MALTFSKTDNSLTVVVNGENGRSNVLTATSNHPQWNKILQALTAQDEEKLIELISVKKAIETYTESNVEIKDQSVWFKGRQLHGLDADRLIQFIREGVPFLPLARFLERKSKNPSFRSINELYKFLEHRKMPITPRGTILGYKGVQENFFSVMGNTSTIMISGETDSGGHILNTVGADIRCERSCVCDDYKQGCSPGLHIGSLEYALGWGKRVVIVEFDPADVVSVPDDCNCQKLRACAYKVVGEYTGALPDSYLNKYNAEEVESDSDIEVDDGDDDGDNGYNVGDGDETESAEDSSSEDAYENGWADGIKDGKAHARRKHYITDAEDTSLTAKELDYINGYNGGYRKGRYNKGKKKTNR